MKKILNVSEMKQVRGGAQPSSMCGEGKKLYTCSTSWMSGTVTQGLFTCATGYNSGFITKGVACGRNASEVAARIREERIWESPNLEYEGINVKCW